MSDLKPLAVHHLAVCVASLTRAESFYCDVLGLRVQQRFTDVHGAPRSVWLALGHGAFLALERAALQAPVRNQEAPGWHCVALGIAAEEREMWRERLTYHAVLVVKESIYTLYVQDPDGNLVGLSHYPHAAKCVAL